MTPKESFQKSAYNKGWQDVVDGPQFIIASEQAMLQFIHDTPRGADMGAAAANNFEIQGAKRYLKILQELALVPKPVEKKPVQKIDYSR